MARRTIKTAKAAAKAPAKEKVAAPKKAEAAKPAEVVAEKPKITAAQAARSARGVVADATNYGKVSNRDDAYLAFYLYAAGNGQKFRMSDLIDKADGRNNPFYDPPEGGTRVATDVGCLNRAKKAGRIVASADGYEFTFTEVGHNQAKACLKRVQEAAKPAKAA